MAAEITQAKAADTAYLTTELQLPKIDLLAAVQKVAALTKTKPRSVAFALLRRSLGKDRLQPVDYFGLGLWRPDLSAQDRAAYASNVRINSLIKTMIGPKNHDASSVMNDKYLCGLLLTANGFDNPQPIAAFSPDRAFGGLRTLTTAAALADYLADPTRPAVFGKPVNGSRALGATPVYAVQPGATTVGLGQGREAPFAALAQEISQNYPRGWLMQELIVQPDDLIDLAGAGVSSLRVVTLWEENGPHPLYAAWRVIAKGGVLDVATAGPRALATIDLQTGRVERARVGDFLNGTAVTHSPTNPDRPLIGYQIPDWPQILRMCSDGHRLFPGHALLGWDIALSYRGPLVQEINASPRQDLFHKSQDRGFFSPDLLARFATAKRLLDDRLARYGEVVRVADSTKNTK